MKGIYDIHCHIVPGVDDGAKDLKTSVRMLQKEYDDGVRNIIALRIFDMICLSRLWNRLRSSSFV